MKMKEIKQERLIEAIYKELCVQPIEKDVIISEELELLHDEYDEKYLNKLCSISFTFGDDARSDLNIMIERYSHRGFEVGFKAALALFDTDKKAVKA